MNMREIYFDNSATTKVFPEVADIVMKTMTEDYGNPSSKHQKGFDAEKYFRTAREQVAETLKVKPREIVFTSGGTESNNTAIFGTRLRGTGLESISSHRRWSMPRCTGLLRCLRRSSGSK